MIKEFLDYSPTNDQSDTLEKLEFFLHGGERVFMLQGYAGSGKTTLLKGLVKYLHSLGRKYQLMAPTGRAAKVIHQKSGFEATTIHKGIYDFQALEEVKRGEGEKDLSFLYQFKIYDSPEVHNSILIVDEASMVSDVLSVGEFFRFGSGFLLSDLIRYSRVQEIGLGSKIIFIGDPAQLPPVGMNFSPALDAKYLEEKYHLSVSKAEMKEVKRQDAHNGILSAATRIRQCLTSGYFNDFDLSADGNDMFNPPYHAHLATYKAQTGQKIIICYKNKTALDLNKDIRRDKFGADLPIQATDTIIIGVNNYLLDIMNGEFAVVNEASPTVVSREVNFYAKKDGSGPAKTKSVKLTWREVSLLVPNENGDLKKVSGFVLENYLYGDNYLSSDEQRALYVDFKNRHEELRKGTTAFDTALRKDEYFNCILLKYGYAVTCHKAQGGEWENAFVFWDKGSAPGVNFYTSKQDSTGKANSEFYRWAYTAVTRASNKLFCINPPRFSSFSGMEFIDVEVQKALDGLSGTKEASLEIKFEKGRAELERFGLMDMSASYQDHFLDKWYRLGAHKIELIDWKKMAYEVRYTFQKDGQRAALKFWVNGKDVFRSNFQMLPAQTNSTELFESIRSTLEESTEVAVIRGRPGGTHKKFVYENELAEDKPFLKNLYQQLSKRLKEGEVISGIEHLYYRERYTIERESKMCVIDFEYNKEGFFGRVLPLVSKCGSAEILESVKTIVGQLKQGDHVN